MFDFRPPKGYPFLFTQAWITGDSLVSQNPDGKNGNLNTSKPNYEAGYSLWKTSPCNNNQSRYDPICLTGLPPRSIFESVHIDLLKNGSYEWLELDNFVYREPAEAVWSKDKPPNDFPFGTNSTFSTQLTC